MKWFQNLTTSAKISLALGTVIFLLGLIIALALSTIAMLRDSQRRLYDHEFASLTSLVELRADLNRTRADILEITIISDRSAQEVLIVDLKARSKTMEESLQKAADLQADNAQFQVKLGELKSIWLLYREAREEQLKLIAEGKNEEVKQSATGSQSQRYEKMRTIAFELEREMYQRMEAQLASSAQLARQSVYQFLGLGVVAMLFGVVVIAVLHRLIAHPLVGITELAERMASGDLTGTLPDEHRSDEVGLLARTFAKMTDNLREQIQKLTEGASVLGSAAGEIVAATMQLSSSAGESATAVSETTTTVEEIRQTAQMASQKARVVSESAQKVAQISEGGRRATDDAVTGMNRIRDQMDSIAGSMVRLSEQSQTIGQIIATVEDLAAQSNLLAVNAAIEAAKAGEHGRGFGVVAQEVKSLAEQSRLATTQVRAILNDIQKATTAAVLSTEQGTKAVEAGGKQTEVAGESIQSLVASVTEAAQTAKQIAASSQQQLVGMDQVALAMENIKQASMQNVASARQLEASARNLSEVGRGLKQMVERYKVSP